jgi:heme/copper-type cytochrome/quinol oxidase subunit 2
MPVSPADAVFWLGVVMCAAAQVAIVRSVVRSRKAAFDPQRADPSSTVPRPHFAVELAWAVVPALALVALFIATWRAMHP